MTGAKNLLAGLVTGIDHIGICVGELDARADLFADLLGLTIAHKECVLPQLTETAFVDLPDAGATVELIAPMTGNVGLERFLAKRGDALHHVAFAVTDLAQALARLDAAGVPLLDRAPRPGARGHQVAFLHPRAAGGILVELVERARH